MRVVMTSMMQGQATDAQMGGFLVALSLRGETIDEVLGAAEAIREMSPALEIPGIDLVDTCGTGGDGAHTFNISTASAIVAAAAGVPIAKHGSRSVSSRSGSADLLEAAGINIELDARGVRESIEAVGLGFLFAPQYHSAMRHVATPRRELGIRTIFNLLGPLTNPARAKRQVVGIFSLDWLEPYARILMELGTRHALVVHAEDGLDEISIHAPTHIAEVRDGQISTRVIYPEMFGIPSASLKGLAVDGPIESLKLIQNLFGGRRGPAFDIVALNAGAAIYVSGKTDTLEAGVRKAQEVLTEGLAEQKLEALVRFSSTITQRQSPQPTSTKHST